MPSPTDTSSWAREHARRRRPAHELRLPAKPSKLTMAREYAQQAAEAFGLDVQSCEDFVFAVNEAVTNAIRHGRADEHGHIGMSVLIDGERLTLSVSDHGTFTSSAPPASAPLCESGRGFALMARLMDAVQLCIEPTGTTVHLSKDRAEATTGIEPV